MDVVVVGGGPAGTKTASLIAKNRDVLIIEEHACSGKPVQCAGVISPKTYEMSGVKPDILNRIKGWDFIFPNEKHISIKTDDEKAYVIDRSELDSLMAEKAIDDGVEIRYSEKFISCKHADKFEIKTTKDTYKPNILIGANGYASDILDNNRSPEYVRGFCVDVKHTMDDQENFVIRVGNDIAPGFFSWQIPMGDTTRIGLCTSWNVGPPFEYFKKLLKKSKLDDCEILKRYSGRIPLGARRRIYDDNIILIGDAASQVKPVSGGGLYPAFIASECVARTIEKAFEYDDFSSSVLSEYGRSWKRALGKRLERDYRFRKKYFVKLTDDDFNRIQSSVSDRFIDRVRRSPYDDPLSVFSTLPLYPKMFLTGMSIVMRMAMR